MNNVPCQVLESLKSLDNIIQGKKQGILDEKYINVTIMEKLLLD